MRHHLTASLLALLAFCVQGAANDNWPQFRGPGARGVADGAGFPDRWSATENIAWKTDLPGRGWSSPVVWGGRVFLTTAVNRGESEPPKKGLYLGGNRPQPPASIHEWWVYCLDLESGEVCWKEKVHEGPPPAAIHIKNSYASETPVTDGERVYSYFGNVGIFTFDLAGKRIWSRPVEPHPTRAGWGTASSPALHGDRLFLVSDNEESSYLLALDKRTGRELWRIARDEKSNWSNPFVWRNEQRIELVTVGSGKVRSYDLDGRLLWELSGMSSVTVPTPFAADGLLYLASGCERSPAKPVYAIRPGASGDISLMGEAASNEFVAWCQPRAAPYVTSPLLYEGILYVLLDRGYLAAYDAQTGEEIYGKQRFPSAKAGFSASPWACDGKIFCLRETGETYVVEAGHEFRVLHVNSLDEVALATPAIVRDSLVIRTLTKLWRIANSANSSVR